LYPPDSILQAVIFTGMHIAYHLGSDLDQVRRLLDQAGFQIEGEYGDYEGTSYREGDSILLFDTVRKTA